MHRTPVLLLVVAGLAAPVLSAATYEEGQAVTLSVGSIPSGYRVYWVSSKNGYLGYGNPYSISTLSVGTHTITAHIYRTSDWVLVYKGSTSLEIVPKQVAPAPAPTPPPPPPSSALTGAPGEFEPVSLLLLGCPDVYMIDDMYPTILNGVKGVVPTRIYADNQYVRYDLVDLFSQKGVTNADYSIVVLPIDSIWIRDYGPLFMKNSGRLEVVDIKYYPGRPYDDVVPQKFASAAGYPARSVPLYWEGGNYTADGRGNLFASDVLYSRNTNYTRTQIDSMVGQAFAGRLNVFDHMLNDGGTGHIDMFMLWTRASSLVLNRFPYGHANYDRMERHATRLSGMGYSVTRLDLADSGYSSYANGLVVNTVVFVPTYANSTKDQAALAAYQRAGYTAIGIDCRRIIQWAGAVHCITITVPS